jgi:peptidoglycan/xylan/chitin deacetylase (PgdA/CDA1 family)/glycosyltransferase involved in cell wall biosynthesis
VLQNVAALAAQTDSDFEVIVVDDGSGDGTAAVLRELETPFPLTVIEQENRGAGAARNAGAEVARGELLLFLDDDMEADTRLLAEHDRSHRDGAEVVLGDLPLHPDSPSNLLSAGVGLWTRTRRERLTAPGAEIGLGELLTGQISISRANYERVGGFDASFTREGLFGGEDSDFGYRVYRSGLRIAFNPDAISYQYYDVDPMLYLRRAFEGGRSEQELTIKHPERAEDWLGPTFHRRRDHWLLGPFVDAPEWVSRPLRAAVSALVRTGHRGPRLRRLFFNLRTMEHLRGAQVTREALSTGFAHVLAYHAIADLRGDPALRTYGVAPSLFARQLDALAAAGWSFIDLQSLLDALAGRRTLEPRTALVTFDDAYADLFTAAAPVLRERGIPAVVFAVSGLTGATNRWDAEAGATELPLLDADGLRMLADHGVEVGAHGATHRSLVGLGPEELEEETQGSADAIEALGLPRPRVFAYPFGEHDEAAAAAVREAGYLAAFTVAPGAIERGRTNPYALPRVQVLAGDTPRKLRLRLIAASMPTGWGRFLIRLARLDR